MRYLSIYRIEGKRFERPPTPEHVAQMGKLIEESMKAGTLVSTGGVSNPKRTFQVRRSGGKISVTDGPYTESKELVAGFAILEATSREHVIEQLKQFLDVAGDGATELHELFDETADPSQRG